MQFNIIVATCNNNGIGINNTLPWNKISKDMKMFSKLTIGNGNNAIIMGKNTFLSIGRPLPKRENIIISSTLNNNNITIINTIKKCLDYCYLKNFDTVWIIGGEKIYTEFLKLNIINNIYQTKIFKQFTCDTFFPEIPINYNIKSFEKISSTDLICILIIWEYKKDCLITKHHSMDYQ